MQFGQPAELKDKYVGVFPAPVPSRRCALCIVHCHGGYSGQRLEVLSRYSRMKNAVIFQMEVKWLCF